MSITSKLSGFDSSSSSADARVQKYKEVIEKIFVDKDTDNALKIVEHVVQDSFPQVVARDIMNIFAKAFDHLQNDQVLELGEATLELISDKNMLEEEECIIRREVASVHQARKDFSDAAKCLMKIKLENTVRNIDPKEKSEILVSIAENWFSEDDAVNAEIYLNKATHVILDVEDEEINTRYRYCKAKVFDSKRKFVFAAQAYYELSSFEGSAIEEDNKFLLLKNAITCAVLAPVGPQKSRILTTLTKDERSKNCPNYEMLERMFNDKVINKKLSQEFESTLEEHQKATGSDGHSILETSVLEHNISVVSNIYTTISFEGLGTFLGISKSNAEKLISNMVIQGRISAILDQRSEIIEFEKNEREKLSIWNEQIGVLCNDVNTVLSKILKEFPEAENYIAQ
ncbi:unnamed protein product [Moneuplotes crassus]|uniref:COP9 signalosome complex subunit 4 n=1 Tax=Euplotes crassus TaxID=5936 RepID=A0AAD1XC14_EUPCR|nr:unnamed protein product [Moneuplotes crassus]